MRDALPPETATGMAYYVTETAGAGGRLRDEPDDFRVTEIEQGDTEPLNADPATYPHLVVRATLRGWDTNDFAAALADRLGISRERVSWAGTKDKRAVTTQLVSIKSVDPDDLPALDRVDLEPVGRLGRSLRFGDLTGNAFQVTIRDPDRPENVAAITEELTAFGAGTPAVPNYFGGQRFGSRRAITHEVGLAIVRGDWEGAVMAYVGNPSDREPNDSRAARTYVQETQDWKRALERMPRRLGFERAILHRLVERGGDDPADFRAALEALPENLQALLVNAAQSFIFNRIISKRLTGGLPFTRAVAGDVVCFAESEDGLVIPDTDRLQPVESGRVDVVNRHLERGRAFVTAPLAGTQTELGGGTPGEIERAVLDDVGIDPNDFDLPGAFGSSGTRRAILIRIDPTIDRDPLRFSFSLPKGSYATVVLREYLKVDPDLLG